MKKMAHSATLKARAVVDYLYFTRNLRAVAKRYNVSKSSVQRWVKEDARGFKRQRSKRKLKSVAELVHVVKRCIEENPFTTMRQIAHDVSSCTGLRISSRTANRYAHLAGKSFKKAFPVVDHCHDNQRVKDFCSAFLASPSIVSVDESCFLRR